MRKNGAFADCHPLVNLLFFTLVIALTVGVRHPVCQLLSLLCALWCRGRQEVRKMWYLLPLLVLTVVLNGLTNHRGVTILCYLPWGNPLTLESLLYGLSAAVMLVTVVVWFSCYTRVMTSDKVVYLFGRIIPALSLVLSMILRFVPRLTAQGRRLAELHRGGSGKKERLRRGVAVLSGLMTWALESAVETADSMKSRGYGLPGRTAYSLFRLDGRDKGLLLWMGLTGGLMLTGWIAGGFAFQYDPALKGAAFTPLSVLWFLSIPALGLTPLWLERKEEGLWKSSSSGICASPTRSSRAPR